MKSRFHLAFNVNNLDQARAFYCDLLGCREGRSTESWVDIDFFDHQLSLHLGTPFKTEWTGKVGNEMVPMPHLGVILPLKEWQVLADRLQQQAIEFVFPPFARFVGEPGEQHTMFFLDPFGNPIEVKGFADFDAVFDS